MMTLVILADATRLYLDIDDDRPAAWKVITPRQPDPYRLRFAITHKHEIAYPDDFAGPLESAWRFYPVGDGFIHAVRHFRLMTVYIEGDGGGWLERWANGARP